MTALELISLINQCLFVGLFMVVLRRAWRERSAMSFNAALLFGAIAGVVVLARVAGWLGVGEESGVTAVTLLLLTAAPFAMLRLVDDFSGTPRWVQIAGGAAFVGVSVLATLAFERMEQLVKSFSSALSWPWAALRPTHSRARAGAPEGSPDAE